MSSIHVHSERSARTGIAIVWPAWFPGSTDKESHCTALFLGSTESVDFKRYEVEEAIGRYLWPAWTKTKGFEMFGYNKDIPVVTLERTNLLFIERQDMKERLERVGIHADNQFAFNPHVTIAKEAEHIQDSELFLPTQIHLEAPVLWWGDDRTLHTEHAKQQKAAA